MTYVKTSFKKFYNIKLAGLLILILVALLTLFFLLVLKSKENTSTHDSHSSISIDPKLLSMENLMAKPVDVDRLGFNPTSILTDFDYGEVVHLPNGQIQRNYTITARDKKIELSPGVFFDAWTYNGRIPGPTIRATEGDIVNVTFINDGTHPHSIHFHGTHPADQDGLEPVKPGERRVYTFPAGPAGLQLYHCHIEPLATHINRGLYGVFIVDPKEARPQAKELVMVMNSFDVNNDTKNDIYAVNSQPFAYFFHPIPITVGETVRVYLVNMTEYDPLNSFHLHANFFNLFRTGTSSVPDEYTDIVEMGQAERHIIEFSYSTPGMYMFHSHQAQFIDRGWMGCFDARIPGSNKPSGKCVMFHDKNSENHNMPEYHSGHN